METTLPALFAAGSTPVLHRRTSRLTGRFLPGRKVYFSESAKSCRSIVSSTAKASASSGVVSPQNGTLKKNSEIGTITKHYEDSEVKSLSLKDYFEQSEYLFRSDGGPPRWFSPLECASRLNNSPLLLSLPGSINFFS